MKDRIIISFLPLTTGLILLFSLAQISSVSAQEQSQNVPPQATCITPQGEKIASYAGGIHGIVGNSSTFAGRDDVYNLGISNALQCFCATDGSGIDTIWWGSISTLTQTQIDGYTASGWIYVPNGALWGLESKPYLAKNTNYTCSQTTAGGSSEGSSTSSGGQVLGSTLAATGGKGAVIGLIYASALYLTIGILLKLKSTKRLPSP